MGASRDFLTFFWFLGNWDKIVIVHMHISFYDIWCSQCHCRVRGILWCDVVAVLRWLFQYCNCWGRKRKRLVDDVGDCQLDVKKMKQDTGAVVKCCSVSDKLPVGDLIKLHPTSANYFWRLSSHKCWSWCLVIIYLLCFSECLNCRFLFAGVFAKHCSDL